MSGTEHLDNYVFIGLTAILSLYILIGAYIHAKKCKYLHESLVILLIAAPLAVIFPKVMKSHDHAESEEPYKISPKISPDIIFQYLLPPIIMSAGFNMRKKFFFKNIGYIGLFGFLGTLLNFVIVTVCFSIFNSMIGLDLPTYNNWDITTVMCLSATLIATDTIAPLTLINQTKYPTLFSVVFGEGVSNDAVALLLMNVVLGFKTETNPTVGSGLVIDFLITFLLTTIKSVGFGVLMGFLSCIFHKIFKGLNNLPELEASLIFIMSLLTYGLCELESLKLAAIVSIFVFGIVQSHYNKYNLSSESVEKAGFTFALVSYICEALILIYLGLSIDSFSGTVNMIYYVLADFGILLFARFFTLFSLSFIVSLVGSSKKKGLSLKELILVGFSGMIRGSIAYALIVKLAYYKLNTTDPEAAEKAKALVNLGQVVIIATMYIFTPLNMVLFTKLLDDGSSGAGDGHEEQAHGHGQTRERASTYELLQKREKLITQEKVSAALFFKRIDEFFLKPLLIRDYEERILKINEQKKKDEREASKGRKTFFDPVGFKQRIDPDPQEESSSDLERISEEKGSEETGDISLNIEIKPHNNITKPLL